MVEFQLVSGRKVNVLFAKSNEDYDDMVDVIHEHLPNYFKVIETTLTNTNK